MYSTIGEILDIGECTVPIYRVATMRRSTRNFNVTKLLRLTGSENYSSTEPGIVTGRGKREAITTGVKVAGVSMNNTKSKELDVVVWRL
jgi:hypothetical protein